jgi:hypothetical protein
MKTLFLKNGMPVAAAVLAIAGAFATTSMQSSKNFGARVGYTLDAFDNCDIAVACSDVPSQILCRYAPTGQVAFGKTPQGACILTLWKSVPVNP